MEGEPAIDFNSVWLSLLGLAQSVPVKNGDALQLGCGNKRSKGCCLVAGKTVRFFAKRVPYLRDLISRCS